LSYFTTDYDSTLNTFSLFVDNLAASMATGFHWDFGDGTTSTQAAPTHLYTIDSLFNVCMKVYVASGDSCEYCHIIGKDNLGNIIRTAGFNMIVQNPADGLKSNSNDEIQVTIAPNPFTTSTSINFSEALKNVNINVTDMLGKEIINLNFSGKQLQLEKGNMKKGIYFLKITTENRLIGSTKLIVNE
jgi:hypothetical protein